MQPSHIHLLLDIHDKLLERSLKELFDPLPNFHWAERSEAHLILTDHPLEKEGVIVIDSFPINTESLLREIEFKLKNVCMTFGTNSFIPASKVLKTPHEEYKLTEKEAKLLMVLLEAEGSTVSKDDLLKRVWNYSTGVDTHTLETHIYRLRQKIETDPAKPVMLKNEENGYLIGERRLK